MRSRVRVVRVTRVHPAAAAGVDEHELELSFLDVMHIAKLPTQRLFFFDGPDLPPFPSMVSALRSSLADTLAVFLPLAGELAFRSSSGALVLDCSSAQADVRFVEAEYLGLGGTDDMRRMAREDEHDTEAFLQLVPTVDVAQLPAPVLAVQVTSGHGAVALGVSMHHAVADSQTMWHFIRAWSPAARLDLVASAGLMPPTFDRAPILQHPMAAELYRIWAPSLPQLRPALSTTTESTDEEMMSGRTFVLTADRIQSVKKDIASKLGGGGGENKVPSTYVTVSSLAWASIIRAKSKSMDHANDAYFLSMVDCRRRLHPPLVEGFFGNCVRGCVAKANVGDLCGEAGVGRAAGAIQESLREVLDREDPLEGLERLTEVMAGIPKERLTTVGSSHRFMPYETDFGWGVPTRVESVSIFMTKLVVLHLHGGREPGDVQVSVALSRPLMEAFATDFFAPLD